MGKSCWKWKKATPDCYPIKPKFQEKKKRNTNCQTEPNKAKWTFLIENHKDVARPKCFENDKNSSAEKEEDFKSNLVSTNQTYMLTFVYSHSNTRRIYTAPVLKMVLLDLKGKNRSRFAVRVDHETG